MKAIRYDLADPEFPASLVEIAEPGLPTGEWARIVVSAGGICGSDLHLFAPPSGGGSPTLRSIGTLPFVLGHEIVGSITEVGPDSPWSVGDRVAVDPDPPRAVRGIVPLCANCARGWPSSCLELDSRVLTPGRSIGFTDGLGGGWGRAGGGPPVHGAPGPRGSTRPDGQLARAHRHRPPRPGPPLLDEGDPILIVGGGIIGLAATPSLRVRSSPTTTSPCWCVTPTRLTPPWPAVPPMWSKARERRPSNSCPPSSGPGLSDRVMHWMLVGGYPYVVEAAGSAGSLTDSLRAVANRGTVVMLGAMGTGRVDHTALVQGGRGDRLGRPRP